MYTCKRCGQYLTYVYQYSRWYCPYCQKYIEDTKKCSRCQRPLTYISSYQKWFCYTCYKYDEPETQSKPITQVAPQPPPATTQPSGEKKDTKKYPTIISKDKSYIQALFLIYQDGRLVETLGKFGGGEGDILSSMLTAVQDFVKESFQTQGSGLSSLQYGKTTVALERGVHVYLAAVIVGGEEPEELRRDMRRCLITIREQFPWILKQKWDGDMERFTGTKRILAEYVWNKYCQMAEQVELAKLEKTQKEKGVDALKVRADGITARLQQGRAVGTISQLEYEDVEGFVNMARRYIDSNNVASAIEFLDKADASLAAIAKKAAQPPPPPA